MFLNREDAALQLARVLSQRELRHPLVLAIPRGGVVLGAVLARELDADLGVVLVRKLRDPYQTEHAIGAIAESGEVYLTPRGEQIADSHCGHLVEESRRRVTELARRRQLYADVGPPPSLEGRTVIVVDDGIDTAATMVVALKMLRGPHHGRPLELLVAVPVASSDGLAEIQPWCDDIICLQRPATFWAVSPFYRDFRQVEDTQVIELLRADRQRHLVAVG